MINRFCQMLKGNFSDENPRDAQNIDICDDSLKSKSKALPTVISVNWSFTSDVFYLSYSLLLTDLVDCFQK